MAAYYEPGRYYVEIVGQGFGQSSEKKTTYFFLTVKPTERILSAEDREPCTVQYERTIFMYITDKTVERVVAGLRELGWEGNDWGELDLANNDGHSFVGLETIAQCDQEVYEGNYREKWQLPGRGSLEHQADPNTVRTLNAMFGKALKGGAAKPAKPKPPTRTQTTELQTASSESFKPDPNDPIPF